jgi:hypothetical protein
VAGAWYGSVARFPATPQCPAVTYPKTCSTKLPMAKPIEQWTSETVSSLPP